MVPSGRFDNASLTTMLPSLPSRPLQMSSVAAPMILPDLLKAGTVSPEAEWPLQAVADVRSLAKGIRWALTIEVAAALGIYFLWHLWQLWR
jgi:hypothetical protein